MLKVNMDEIQTSDYDIYFEATLDGKPFTGIAVEDDGDIHSEYTYRDGVAHGRWSSVYSNGNIQSRTILDNGKEISEQVWSKEGKLTYEFTAEPLRKREYFKNGELKYNEDSYGYTFYLPGGKILRQFSYSDNYATIYNSEGDWLVKHISPDNKSLLMDEKYLKFNDDALAICWKQWLVDNVNMELYAGGYPDIYPYFVRWITSLIAQDKMQFAAQIVIEMIEQEYLAIKYNGITLAMKHKIKDAIPAILNESDNNQIPSNYAYYAFGFTVGQIARMSIKEIQEG